MTTPASGEISIQDIVDEFGGTAPHALSEYYGAGGVPSSGELTLSDFYGRSNAQYVTATGGTITTSGDYKIHTFTTTGNTQVFSVYSAPANFQIEYLVVGGGGGGGMDMGGGGGGGGVLSGTANITAPAFFQVNVGAGGWDHFASGE